MNTEVFNKKPKLILFISHFPALNISFSSVFLEVKLLLNQKAHEVKKSIFLQIQEFLVFDLCKFWTFYRNNIATLFWETVSYVTDLTIQKVYIIDILFKS